MNIFDIYKILIYICFSIIALIAIIYFYMKKGLHDVKYSRSFSKSGVFEGENVELIEIIRNKGIIPLFAVDVQSFINKNLLLTEFYSQENTEMQSFTSRFTLFPFMQIKRHNELKCLKRGYYNLESVDTWLLVMQKNINANTGIYVYPKLIGTDKVPQNANNLQGDYYSRRWLMEDPFSVSGIRDYQSGDQFGKINFKASAKSGKLKVNIYDNSSSKLFMVYLNYQSEESMWNYASDTEKIEYGLSYAATLINSSVKSGIKTGFAANCSNIKGERCVWIERKSGYPHLKYIYEEMAKTNYKISMSFNALLDIDLSKNITNAEIFIITGFISDTVEKQIALFKKTGNTVNIINI